MAEHLRCYVPKKFGEDRLKMIVSANRIMAEYDARGLVLTLRQLYYQHVARGLIENTVESYSRLGRLISEARLAGLISWTGIEDRRRNLKGTRYYRDPASAVSSIAASYTVDKWIDQPMRPEVWIEKEALEGVVAGVCSELQVDYFCCVGYNSQSEQWRAGRRFAGYVTKGQRPVVFHLGDHDPSGLDMTRDNRDRLSMFAGTPVQVVRLALNRDQVERYRPPPNPAKVTDARFAAYELEHGDECWELDALDPAAMVELIRDAVIRVRDPALWEAAETAEAEEREVLQELAASWRADRDDPA